MVFSQFLNVPYDFPFVELLRNIGYFYLFSKDHFIDEDAEAGSQVELAIDDSQCEEFTDELQEL